MPRTIFEIKLLSRKSAFAKINNFQDESGDFVYAVTKPVRAKILFIPLFVAQQKILLF